MTIDKYLLAKDFSFLCTDNILINKFTKESSDLMTYQTTRSAFIIPVSGRAEIIFDQQTFWAEPGNVIHGCPDKKVSFQKVGNEPFVHINLYYIPSPGILAKISSIHSTFDFTVNDIQRLIILSEELNTLYHSPSPKCDLKKEAVLQKLLSVLFPENAGIKEQKHLIEASVKYIKTHYSSPLTLEQLALQFNKTPSQFSYLFNKHMNIRPIDYIIQYRLKVALALLKEGCQVKEAALKVGYQDAYYFSRLFKKHFNLSPSQVQKQLPTIR